jgi:hemolysin activation/secretion protein
MSPTPPLCRAASYLALSAVAWLPGLLLGLALVASGPAAAEPPIDPVAPASPPTPIAPEGSVAAPADGPAYSVDTIVLGYHEDHPEQPELAGVLPVKVKLTPTPTGYVMPRPGEPSETVRIDAGSRELTHFHASALSQITRALLESLHDNGLLGVYVIPSPKDIDPDSEEDLRPEGESSLSFSIWIGRIHDLRTVALGDRIKSRWKVDNPAHRRILSRSPLAPADVGRENTTDLLRKDLLEEYLFQLNRHPGRHVEAALAASDDGEGITLDYRVFEPRPWTVYAQASNTGTQRTNVWQSRWGYINRQVTGRDDILTFEYMNSGLNDVNGISLAYESPFFRKGRPAWMESTGKEPGWIRWANRSRVPWWGVDRLRWRVHGGWSRFEAGTGIDVGADDIITNDWNAGGKLIFNAWQHRNFFLDTYGGISFRGVNSDNLPFGNDGKVTYFQGDVGLKMERVNPYSTILGSFGVEGASALGDTNELTFGQDLSRPGADSQWALLRFDLGVSHFLEPLIMPRRWRDPETAMTSTLSHELSIAGRGQYAFDYRLIPQVSQVIGGLYSVRGFEQGTSVGDSVFLGTVEYRFHIPRALPIRRKPMQLPLIGDFRITPQQVYGRPDWDLILRGFVDAGRSVRNQNSEIPSQSAEWNETLVGAGVGLELIFKGRIRARVDWARGIYQDVELAGGCTDPENKCPRPSDIDPSGRFHFLFSVMY